MGTKKQTTTEKIPSWLEQGSKQAVSLGEKIGQQTYTPFTGPRVAEMTPNERQASALATSGATEGMDVARKGVEKIGEVQDLASADLTPYKNQYTEEVIQPQIRESNREYDRQRAALLNSKASALGGDRAAFQESELNRVHGEQVSDITGRGHKEALDFAMNAFNQDQDRKLRAADAYRTAGGDITRMNSQSIQDLMVTGGLNRVLDQAKLDFNYQQFTENRDWDVRNLQPLLASLQVPATRTTESKSKGDAFGQILGAATTVAGAYFTGGASLFAGGLGKGVGIGTGMSDIARGGVGSVLNA